MTRRPRTLKSGDLYAGEVHVGDDIDFLGRVHRVARIDTVETPYEWRGTILADTYEVAVGDDGWSIALFPRETAR